jgi:N-methylhydantoinase B
LCRNILDEGDGPRLLPAKTLLTIHTDAVLRHELAGAGGWGNPLERDPRRVLEDVRNGKVTVGHAREAYGVVVSEDASAVDLEATQQLRAARAT